MRHPSRLRSLPVLVLMPHSRCNCRCIMCDIWKANREGTSLDEAAIAQLAAELSALGTQEILLSGGEALMHPNLWRLCAALKTLPLRITLLSTGLLLKRHAAAIVRWCDEVIVSLDGSPSLHDAIRNIPGAFTRMAEGIAALHAISSDFPVFARCVVQRRNFRDLDGVLESARQLGLRSISFLAADLSSAAFNRPQVWEGEQTAEICLSPAEACEFVDLLDSFIARHATDFATSFISESPVKLRRLAQYYRAVHGKNEFPAVHCNAPWVSAVVESDGTVRPCFFHKSIGNIAGRGLTAALNSPEAVAFRTALDVGSDPICRRCVCSLNR